MAGTSTENHALQLDAKDDGERLVVLTPDDEDRFVRSCQWVVEASKLGIGRDLWLRELHSMLRWVLKWAEDHADRVRACFATRRDDQIAIFVVPKLERFDFELSDPLTELDVELAQKFQFCPCDVFQAPREPSHELDEAPGHGSAILIYGFPSTAQNQVAS